MELIHPTVYNYGLYAEHNMPCAVCSSEPAVYNCNTGVMQPCWACKQLGFKLVQKRKRFWQR